MIRFNKSEDKTNFLNEVKLLEKMDHPGIVKLYEVFQDNASFYFVTELC